MTGWVKTAERLVCQGGLVVLLASTARLAAGQVPAQWYVHTGGVSRHGSPTHAPGQNWREVHPGLGLEQRVSGDDPAWSWRRVGGVLQDSRAVWGGYGGAAAMRRWSFEPQGEIGLGIGAYLFYRSVSWDGRRALVPAVLPTLSIGAPDSPIGLNVLYAPRTSTFGRERSSVLYAQVLVRLD